MAGLFTAAARRYIGKLRGELGRDAVRLERRFAKDLRRHGWSPAQILSLLPLTAVGCARSPSLARFLAQSESHARRLAKLQVSPEATLAALGACGRILGARLKGRFGPAREQLELATRLVVDQAFYEVRDAETRALFALTRAELEAVDLDDLLRRFVRILVETFDASAGWLVVLEPGIQERAASPRCFQSIWSYPFGRSAVLQLAFGHGRCWLPREQGLLAEAAVRCQEARERERLKGEIQRLEAEARHSEEEERRRIGRELHDEAGQALMTLRLELELLEREAPAGLRTRLAEARELAGHTAVELRRIVAALSPAILERLGLEAAVRQVAARFCKQCRARLRMRIQVRGMRLSTAVQQVVYRVAQECLNNIARHSGASVVNLSLQAADKNIKLSVRDNGAGFGKDQGGGTAGFGLAGMRERAKLLGGKLTVSSRPGKGTRIQLELPPRAVRVESDGKNSRSID